MIYQKYKFLLAGRGLMGRHEVHPVYKDLKEENTKDEQNMYFKQTLNGSVTFKGEDYQLIVGVNPFTTFYLDIVNSATGEIEIHSTFRYVDLEIDKNKESVKVNLNTRDNYKSVLANLETEYDLIKLKPDLVSAGYNVSNCLQITTGLSQTTTNIYRRNIVTKGSSIVDLDELARGGFSPWHTISTLWFDEVDAEGKKIKVIGKSEFCGHRDLPTEGDYDESRIVYDDPSHYPEGFTPKNYSVYTKFGYYTRFEVEKNGQTLQYQARLDFNYIPTEHITTYTLSILAIGQTVRQFVVAGDPLVYPWNGQNCDVVTLVSGVLANVSVADVYHPAGSIKMKPGLLYYNYAYARLLSRSRLGYGRRIDNETDSDIYSDYYQWVQAYKITGGFKFSLRVSTEPTEYGVAYKEGSGDQAVVYYYQTPDDNSDYEPFVRDEWYDGWSVWIDKSYVFNMFQSDENRVENSNFSEVGSVIKVLLHEIDPSIKFNTSKDFSSFLYDPTGFHLTSEGGRIGLLGEARILITQKSNTTKPNPDYFAMKAPITLGSLLEMLKGAFNIYWFIDEKKNFRLEHISWFENNGTYDSTSSAKIELKDYFDKFNNKSFSYNTNHFTYDLTQEYSRYKLTWPEESTEPFNGKEVKMEETFDDSNKLNEVSINSFYPDIEYQAVFGRDLTKDGFAVVLAIERDKYTYLIPEVPEIPKDTAVSNRLVNGDMCLPQLFIHWLCYNLPSKQFVIDGIGLIPSASVTKSKKNTIAIPNSIPIPSLYTILATEVGDGHITKVSRDIDTEYLTIELQYSK